MARFDKGVFDGFHGRLGNLVGYTLNGKNVVRTIGEVTKPPTLPQLAVRQKIAVVNHILSAMLGFINAGFELAVAHKAGNAYNEATSYNFKYATTGTYPNISIDYSKMRVSQGTLMPAVDPAVNFLPDGIEFTWQADEDMEWSIKNDRAMLLIYYPDKNEAIYILSGAQRYTGRDFIPLAPSYLNQPMETYLSFMADDKKSISNSIYVGG